MQSRCNLYFDGVKLNMQSRCNLYFDGVKLNMQSRCNLYFDGVKLNMQSRCNLYFDGVKLNMQSRCNLYFDGVKLNMQSRCNLYFDGVKLNMQSRHYGVLLSNSLHLQIGWSAASRCSQHYVPFLNLPLEPSLTELIQSPFINTFLILDLFILNTIFELLK